MDPPGAYRDTQHTPPVGNRRHLQPQLGSSSCADSTALLQLERFAGPRWGWKAHLHQAATAAPHANTEGGQGVITGELILGSWVARLAKHLLPVHVSNQRVSAPLSAPE